MGRGDRPKVAWARKRQRKVKAHDKRLAAEKAAARKKK
jgi:hypothetical protein